MRAKYAFAALLGLCLSSSAWCGHQVGSIHDLPSKWTGVAGNLIQRVQGTLTIGKVSQVSREDRKDGTFTATYQVEATMSFGENKILVEEITLDSTLSVKNIYSVQFKVNDELVSYLHAMIRYDEASDTFFLKQLPENGQRSFSLQAAAR